MSFKDAVINDLNNQTTLTDNGMVAHVTSASALIDLFNVIGSSRGTDITKPFYAALAADEDKAVRILLWSRDVLEGSGEREQFRNLLQKLEAYNHKLAAKLIPKIPELGRWDDLFYFKNLENQALAFDHYGKALKSGNALAAKWAPRERSAKKAFAYALRKHLNLKPKEYRKLLVSNTDVVETKMCSNEWSDINYSHVPSVASLRYQKAFERHTPEKYQTYINALTTGDLVDGEVAKVNSKTLYPHDIIMALLRGHDAVAFKQWDELPNYCGDNKILPLVDVSASMGYLTDTSAVEPIHTAVALGLYLADKSTGPFKDMFLTFTHHPEFVTIQGDLRLKMEQMNSSNWGGSTDLVLAIKKILDTAIFNRVLPEDMPEYLLVLSDMEFDHNTDMNIPALEHVKQRYAQCNYKVPQIVFWNLSRNTGHIAAKHNDQGVTMISGFSPAIMKHVFSDTLDQISPDTVMIETIMSDRYKI